MATEAPPQARCPTCGAKLLRTHLSLCAYCGSPLDLNAKTAPPDDEVTRRLIRIREHPEFQGKLAWNPGDRELEAQAARIGRFSWPAIGAGILAAIVVAFARGAPALWFVPAALVALGLALRVASSAARARAKNLPMLKRPALVLSRRSEMDPKDGATLYFFSLRFDDGSEGEFRFPGRGTQFDPMANGATGVAYTRADRLLEFRRSAG